MQTLIIYHQIKPGIDCADGIAAAWVAKRKFPNADVQGCSYGEELNRVNGYGRIVIVDFSFPLATLTNWQDLGIEVLVIDHHKTAMADLSQFTNAVFNIAESGATLAWKTFFPNEPIPAWLEYVKDRDLWNFDLPLSKDLHEAIAFTGRKFYQIDFYCSLSQDELCSIFGWLGERLLRPKRERIAEIAETASDAVILNQHSVRLVKVEPKDARLISDLCSYIYKQHPDADLVCTYTDNPEKDRLDLSFRSDKSGGNFDVAEVARQLNGGGHHNAAGGWVAKDDFYKVFEV